MPRTVPEASQTATESYGGQIVTADVAGLLLTVLVGNLAGSSGNELLVVAPYLLASPLIHLIHGHPGRSASSLLLHVTAPVLGILTGFLIGSSTCNSEEFCGLGGAAIGFLGGMIAATTIDAAVLAHNVPLSRPAYRSSLTPIVSVARASTAGGPHGVLGFAGQF